LTATICCFRYRTLQGPINPAPSWLAFIRGSESIFQHSVTFSEGISSSLAASADFSENCQWDLVSFLCGVFHVFHGFFVWHVISEFLSVEDFGFPLECLVLDHSLNIVFPVLVSCLERHWYCFATLPDCLLDI
jgi:hypothetical protein